MKKRTDVNNKCHIEIKHSHWGGRGKETLWMSQAADWAELKGELAS